MNYVYAAVIIALAMFGSVWWGEHQMQVEWDKDKAARQAVLDNEVAHNKANVADLKDKFDKEIKHAESKAGKRAVADFLRRHGLLPDGTPVSVPGGDGQAEGSGRVDGAACESGFAERIKEFAERCLYDARKVEMCTEWAKRENLEVVE